MSGCHITNMTEEEMVEWVGDILDCVIHCPRQDLDEHLDDYTRIVGSLAAPFVSRVIKASDIVQGMKPEDFALGQTDQLDLPTAEDEVSRIKAGYAEKGLPCFICVK